MASALKRKRAGSPIEPADNIGSVFTARRDLLLVTRQVVRGSGLGVEDSDLLISLYGARALGWDDIQHDAQGFVTFNQLVLFLVHNPSLLSRRLGNLSNMKPPLVEINDVDPTSGLHFNAKQVRITDEGMKRIEPVWRRYQQISAKLVADIPQSKLDHHFEVNTEISARIRTMRSGLNNLFSKNP